MYVGIAETQPNLPHDQVEKQTFPYCAVLSKEVCFLNL